MSAITFSLHIGVNSVDTNHYKGWDGRLQGCENDALFYHDIAKREGCTRTEVLLSSDTSKLPTSKAVLAFLDQGIADLHQGDNLIITYSGHGGTVEDKNHDEDDFQDETWCLYDRQLLDDELFQRFGRFKPGVNIFVISDSCHSGSIVRGDTSEATPGTTPESTPDTRLRRFVPRDKLFDTFQANRYIYEPLMRLPIVRTEDIPASVLQLGACQDNEYAMEDGPNGLFTKTIMKILERNAEISSYQELLVRTKRALTGIQQPNLLSYGSNHQLLIRSKPFGSSFHEGSYVPVPFFEERGSLIIECGVEEVKLDTFKEFLITETLPVPGKDGYTRYHCSCAMEEPGMYPWDHAYRQYRWLKEKSFPVYSIEPEFPAPGTLPETETITTNDLIDILLTVFKGRIVKTKGVGIKKETEDDEFLLKMFAIETIAVLKKDPELAAVAKLDAAGMQAYLNEQSNLDGFRMLVKNSIYSSDTLTVHM